MKTTVTRRELGVSMAALLCLAGGRRARAAEMTTLRFASVGGTTDAGLYLADDLGFFKAEGLNVDRQIIPSAPTLTAAIATGQLDIGGISITPALFTSVEQGINLRIVGDKQSLRPGFSASRMIVRAALDKGNEAATVAGLKGKTIAVSAKGAMTYFFLVGLLKKHGLAPSDIKVAEISYPSMVTALQSGAIDGAVPIEPFCSQMLQSGSGKEVSDLIEFAFPPQGMSAVAIVYSENFRKNRALGDAFMRAYVKGVRVYNDAFVKGKDKDKVIDIVARYAKLDPKLIRASYPAGLDPNQHLNIAAFDEVEKFYLAQNFIRSTIPAKDVVDTSFADDAVKALGPYK